MGTGLQNPYFFIGVIENNVDERLEGRVQVRAFGIHGTVQEIPTEDLPWAVLIQGGYDVNSPIPPLNSWVFGFFLDGRDAQQPMILGLIPTQMTEPVDPIKNGWGSLPSNGNEGLSAGSRPEDFGQPANSRLGRGEYIEETYVPLVEANRKTGIDVPDVPGLEPWEEPGAAYEAQYPYNRVIQSAAGHSIELDDTPGAERIMVYHKSGSYIQIDSRGTTSHKATADRFDITENNMHVFVGGRSIVTIDGDSFVRVNGNKTEEIMGDYVQNIHGNHLLSVGGQINFNASDEIQQRAAKIRIQANVEGVSIKSAKNIKIQSDQSIHTKAGIALFSEAANSINMKAGDNIFIQADGIIHGKSETMYLNAEGALDLKGGHVKAGGGTKVSISADIVAIDDIILLANNQSTPPDPASGSTEADPAEAAELPEPTSKGVSVAEYRNRSSLGVGGFGARDESNTGGASGNQASDNVAPPAGDITAATEGVIKPLLDFIGNLESSGYDTIYGGISRSDYPAGAITSLTIQELLNWQDSIDSKYNSEASGRYQFMEDTLRAVYNPAGLSASDLFSPTNQDKLAIYQMKYRGLDRYLNGSITAETFCNNLAKEWASLPLVSGPNAGKSYYAGDSAGNKSLTSASAFLTIVKKLKTDYDTQGTDTVTETAVTTNTSNVGPSEPVNNSTPPEVVATPTAGATSSATAPTGEKVLYTGTDDGGRFKVVETEGVDAEGYSFKETKRVYFDGN
jgi:muramidase (phage lysozyme)